MQVHRKFRITKLVRTPGDVRPIIYNKFCKGVCSDLAGLDWGGWESTSVSFSPFGNLFDIIFKHRDGQPPMGALPDDITLYDIWVYNAGGGYDMTLVEEVKFAKLHEIYRRPIPPF